MDHEELRSELHALKQLYGLLKSNGHSLQNESSEILDQKARLLLRKLLDAASVKIFEAHAEVLAAQYSRSYTPSFTQQDQSIDALKLLKDASNSGTTVLQSISKDLNSQELIFGTDKWDSSKRTSQAFSSEQSRLSASEPEVRRKRCRLCNRSSVKQQIKETKIPERETQDFNKGIAFQHEEVNLPCLFRLGDSKGKGLESCNKAMQPANTIELPVFKRTCKLPNDLSGIEVFRSGAIHTFTGEVRKAEEEVRKAEEDDPISKEASAKIQQIELCFLASEVAAKHAGLFEKKSASQCPLPELLSRTVLGNNSVSSKNELSQLGKFVVGRNDSKSKVTSRRVWKPDDSTRWHQATNQMTSQFREMKLPNRPSVKTSKPLLPNNTVLSQFVSQNVGKNKGIVLKDDRLDEVGQPVEGYKFSSQKEVAGQNFNAVIDKIKSLNPSQYDNVPMQTRTCFQGSHVPSNRREMGDRDLPLPTKLLSQIDKENLDKSQMSSVGSKILGGHTNKIQAADSGSELSRAQTSTGPRKITRQTLVENKLSQLTVSPTMYEDQVDPYCDRIRKKNNQVAPKRLISQVSESSSANSNSNSNYSSSWTTQQASTSYSDVEGYLLSGPTTSSEREPYSGSDSKLSSRSSESEMYSISSRTRRNQVDYSDSSSDRSVGSTSIRAGSTKDYRLANRKEKKKQVGRLRKLKDKLAIIFQHHHHHHHHHHHGADENQSDQKVKVQRGKSLWKYAGKNILDRRSKAEAYGEQSVKNIKRSVVRKVADKNQQGHFHALVEGMLQHVRHSKKSKPCKGDIKKSRNNVRHGRKQVVKKMHWWQMLRHQRRLKVPEKPRANLGEGGKKPKLRGLPETR